jgi:hypothetical protein
VVLSQSPFLHLCDPIVDLPRVSDDHVPTSLLPQSCCGGLDKGDDVVVPLDGGHGNHLGRVLCAVAGGGDRGVPLNGLASGGVIEAIKSQVN